AEKEIPGAERRQALSAARGHWLLALGELEAPSRKACLILIGGLPGSGKSTLAKGLAERGNFVVLRSDAVRKELAGLPWNAAAPAAFGEGIYTPASSDATYIECLSRAEQLLFEGKRVIVDASFGQERRRIAFLELAARLCVPAVLLLCHANLAVIEARLRQ